jgi:uncharacterized membrane protein YfcA
LIIAGYIAFLLIGLILGLIGGGGSILGVPVLVYLLCYGAEEATTYSLFIVGLTSLIGALTYLKKGEISAEALVEFAIASLISVFCVRRFLIPAIPEVINFPGFEITKDGLIMVVFAIVILCSSYSMIRKRKPNYKSQVRWEEFARSPLGLPFTIILGIFVGLITGFVGAGGGFIIVPVLMFVMQLNFKKAIGTSLCIIALNSLIGFLGNVGRQQIDWLFLVTISAISIVGILIGSGISGKIPAKKLKPSFGWFTLAVGIFVFLKETVLAD